MRGDMTAAYANLAQENGRTFHGIWPVTEVRAGDGTWDWGWAVFTEDAADNGDGTVTLTTRASKRTVPADSRIGVYRY